MKLLRHGPSGQERPGILDAEGKIRDLSGKIDDIDGDKLSPARLKELAAIDPARFPSSRASRAWACRLRGIGKFIAIGLNFSDHAAESGLPMPPEPIVFTKAITCITGPNDDVMIPRGSKKTDWEVELGVVIGTHAPLCRARPTRCSRRRLLRRQRRLGARVPDGARRHSGTRARAATPSARRPLAGHARRDRRRAEPRHVARRQRPAHADGQHRDDDLRRGRDASATSAAS